MDTRSKRDNRNCLTSDKSTNNRNNIGVNGEYCDSQRQDFHYKCIIHINIIINIHLFQIQLI